MAYLDLGLIPYNQYSRAGIGSLDKLLASLDENSRRKVTRKFRKMVKKTRIKQRSPDASSGAKQSAVYFYIVENNLTVSFSDNDEC